MNGKQKPEINSLTINFNKMKSKQLQIIVILLLFTSLANAQIVSTDSVKLKVDNGEFIKAKKEIANLLKNKYTVFTNKDNNDKNHFTGWNNPVKITVYDDRIEFANKDENAHFNFSELADFDIFLVKPDNKQDGPRFGRFLIYSQIPGNGQKLADNLNLIKKYFIEVNYLTPLRLFEPIAAQYRATKIKPTISEEQRKFIVQANLFNQLKNYLKAIELYQKVIALDPTSYPSAYSNLALISAIINNYNGAIYYMKTYLLLEPEATDARSCQDKIYEWEALSGK